VASLCFHPGAESGSRFQSGAFPVHRMQTRTLWLCLMPVCSLHILSWCVDVKMQGFQVLTEPQPVFNVAVLYVHGKWLQEQALNRPAGPVVSLANNSVLLHHGLICLEHLLLVFVQDDNDLGVLCHHAATERPDAWETASLAETVSYRLNC